MDIDPLILVGGLIALVAAAGAALAMNAIAKQRQELRETTRMLDEALRRQADSVERLAESQAALGGRVGQIAESSAVAQERLTTALRDQERVLAKRLDDRLADVGKRVGESLEKSSEKSQSSLTELKERLAVIDAAQKNITELSTQVVGLQDILSNKQARGAFGEIQLSDIVTAALPPNAYDFQVTLDGGVRADCLLKLPNPPGPIVIDAKFPLESFTALHAATSDAERDAARKALGADILRHVKAIAEKYIIPGVTAESALMFLPSEAIYAELHANLGGIVAQSFRERVWIVSPTTLMATLNTVRAVLKDARMREQAHVIRRKCMSCFRISDGWTSAWATWNPTFTKPRRIFARSGFHRTKSPNAVSGSRKSKLARLNLSCRRILRKFKAHPYNHFKSLLAP